MNTATYRLREAAQFCHAHECVEAADIVTASDGSKRLELVVSTHRNAQRRVPPALLSTLADRGVGIRECLPRGDPQHLLVVCI